MELLPFFLHTCDVSIHIVAGEYRPCSLLASKQVLAASKLSGEARIRGEMRPLCPPPLLARGADQT